MLEELQRSADGAVPLLAPAIDYDLDTPVVGHAVLNDAVDQALAL